MSFLAGYACSASFICAESSYVSDYLDWALPDQLVFSTVSALLRLSGSHLQYAEQATSTICDFIEQTVTEIGSSSGGCYSNSAEVC